MGMMWDPGLEAVSWTGVWVTARRAAAGLDAQALEAAAVMAPKKDLRWDAATRGALWVGKDPGWTLLRFFFKSVRFASRGDHDWVGP